MSLMIDPLYPLRLLDLRHEHTSLLLVSTVVVCPICAVSNVVVPDQTELAWKMIFSDPRHRPTRDAGAGRLFVLVYLEATPSLTGGSTKLCIYLYFLPAVRVVFAVFR